MIHSDLYLYWGKGAVDSPGSCHLLVYHCFDTAAVAYELLDSDQLLLNRLAGLSRFDPAVVHSLVTLLACLHDLGKFSMPFQSLLPDLTQRLSGRQGLNRGSLRHSQLGLLLWDQVLKKSAVQEGWWGLDPAAGPAWLETLKPWLAASFNHHGRPEGNPLNNARVACRRSFQPQDQNAALELARTANRFWGRTVTLPRDGEAEEYAPYLAASSWLAAGILVASDWLASNPAYFPHHCGPLDLAEYWQISRELARKALRGSGIAPARTAAYSSPQALFPYLKKPTPLQAWAAETGLPPGPKLFILEESTGGGKTEAALILAQRIMAQKEAESLFVALPTMATANSMYSRLAGHYRRLFMPQSAPSLTLAHSLRRLHAEFQGTVNGPQESGAGPKGEEESLAQCSAWLADSNKRSLLGSVGIGTIDQAVAAMIPLKHQSLRLMGLARSVLILDEVHACDEYLTTLLSQGILSHLAALGCSVILLSATLPQEMKKRLAKGFWECYQPEFNDLQSDNYPLATVATPFGVSEHPLATREERRTSFEVELCDSSGQVRDALIKTASQGACAFWIRNTVNDAMEAWRDLSNELGRDKVWLFHARFALCDRLQMEERVVTHFGPGSTAKHRAGRIVVGTQVMEQSLDLDFDFGVSDLAPVDLLLQRAGRLHRHQRRSRPIAEPRLMVYGPRPEAEPGEDWYSGMFPGGAWVYGRHSVLWRTARELALAPMVRLPEDARRLVEAVYDPFAGCPEGLAGWEEKSEGEAQAARDQAWFNTLNWRMGYGGVEEGWSEDTPTRLGEKRGKLILARWEDERLTPWSGMPGWQGWELSQVSLKHRLAAFEAEVNDSALSRALEQVRAGLGRRGADCLIVPLRPAEDGYWEGRVLDAGGAPRGVTYHLQLGLDLT